MGSYFSVVVFARPGVTLASAVAAGGEPDEAATQRWVERSHPTRRVVGVYDTTMNASVNLGDDVHAAVFPGMALLFSPWVDLDHPSRLQPALLGAGLEPGLWTLAAGVVENVGWAGFGLWDADHRLVRSVSLAGGPIEHEVKEIRGAVLDEERPWWAGELHPHPQTLVERVLRTRVGFGFDQERRAAPIVDLAAVPILEFDTTDR